jgi:hypothetical protein
MRRDQRANDLFSVLSFIGSAEQEQDDEQDIT